MNHIETHYEFIMIIKLQYDYLNFIKVGNYDVDKGQHLMMHSEHF